MNLFFDVLSVTDDDGHEEIHDLEDAAQHIQVDED